VAAKSPRQHAYEVGVELQLAIYRRSRKAYILKRRFERLVGNLTTVEDLDWLDEQLVKRFPEVNKVGKDK
jgi:hypothetical protein